MMLLSYDGPKTGGTCRRIMKKKIAGKSGSRRLEDAANAGSTGRGALAGAFGEGAMGFAGRLGAGF